MSSALALQSAIHQRLTADATLVAILGAPRIYDDAPQAEAFPYVTFGASTVSPLDGTAASGDDHVVTLQVFSRGKGRKEAALALDAIESALDDAALTLTGHRLVSLAVTFKELRRDADGETRRGLVRLRAFTEPLAP